MTDRPVSRAAGFTLLELMIAMSIFLVICGLAFGMLMLCMKRYQAESQLLGTFQEARFGIDQIVRDVNGAGYPPRNQFSVTPSSWKYAVSPFAWAPGYPSNNPCFLGGGGGGGGCSTPSSFDLIVETDVDPLVGFSGNGVEWVRYQLGASDNTLYRAVVNKHTAGTNDPDAATAAALVPYVQNVVNNPSAADLADLQAAYPAMFSSGPVPIFRYWCDSAAGPTAPPVDCSLSLTNVPSQIQSISITLIIMAPYRDQQTNRPIVVELKGRGRRINPSF